MTPKYGAEQLERGRKYEQFVRRLLSPWGLTFWVYEDPLFQQTKGESLQGVEVKEDAGCVKYGHPSIEVAEKSNFNNPEWVPSGIFKPDNSWAYIQGNYEIVFVFGKRHLLNYYEKKKPLVREHIERSTGGAVRKFHLPDHDDGLGLAMRMAVLVLDGTGKRLNV